MLEPLLLRGYHREGEGIGAVLHLFIQVYANCLNSVMIVPNADRRNECNLSLRICTCFFYCIWCSFFFCYILKLRVKLAVISLTFYFYKCRPNP